MLYAADLGSAGLTDVGYVWKNADGTDLGTRQGPIGQLESGIYGADITPPAGAQAIYWDSAAEDTSATAMGGIVPDNFESLVIDSAGQVDADVRQWLGTAAATPTTAGVPEVDVTHVGGTAQTAGDLAALVTTLDTVADAIKAKTDNLTFTTANKVDSRVDNVAGTVQTAGDLAALIVASDAVVDAIKAVTDNLPDSGSLTTLQADTDDIQTRLPAALVGGRIDADMGAISTSTDAADKLEASAETMVIGAAEAGTLSTTQMTSDLTEVTDDHFNGRIIIWTSGVLLRQATDITGYSGATGLLTFTAVTEAPSAGDSFIVV